MAVVLGMYDADSERLALARARVPASLAGGPHLVRREISFKNLCIWWEASASTPVSHAEDARGPVRRMVFAVGDPDSPGHKEAAATRLLAEMGDGGRGHAAMIGRDGFHLVVMADEAGRIALGTDALGYFPLCFWEHNGIFIFGTSPELFTSHPNFSARPNAFAIASLLLFSHISGGQTVFEGVRRSTPGCCVLWRPGESPREEKVDPVVMSDAWFGLAYEDVREKVSGFFGDWFEQIRPNAKVDFFLSGGQDSRLVAAYAGKCLPRESVRAVSLGRDTDMELRFARNVTRALGWEHRVADVQEERFAEFASAQLRLESLQGPFVNFSNATGQSLLSESGSPFVSGYCGDIVIGDKHLMAGFSMKSGLFCVDELVSFMNRYGYARDDVAMLIAPLGGKEVVDDVIDGLRDDWNGIEGYPFQRVWLFAMTHRARLHVGSIVWRLSLGAWPLLPYLDRRLIELVSGMPLAFLKDRRLQRDILVRDFPELARLPLDRNSWEPGYLVKPRGRVVYEGFQTIANASWRLGQAFRRFARAQKTRYYYRTYDFNGPGWQAVRRMAEPFRQDGGSLLNPDIVRSVLPKADTFVPFSDGIVEPWRKKTVAGVLCWGGFRAGLATDEGSGAACEADAYLGV